MTKLTALIPMRDPDGYWFGEDTSDPPTVTE